MLTRKHLAALLVSSIWLFLGFYYFTQGDELQVSFEDPLEVELLDSNETPSGAEPPLMKKILLWNSPNRIEVAAFGIGHEAFISAGCPVRDCEIVANSSAFWSRVVSSGGELLSSFDAILINMHELWLSFMPGEGGLHYPRPARQRLVWLTQESPQTMSTIDPARFDGLFNWTMSYKRNSDVQLLYGRTLPIGKAKKNAGTLLRQKVLARIKERSKAGSVRVVWMASHCETASRREEYVRQLQEDIPVDVYGTCGSQFCSRNESHWISDPECYSLLASKGYKFYLSFENSICEDYVTEKFFSVLQHGEMVPVVLGGADYRAVAPPHSFINALDFPSPAELAAYLRTLDSNDSLYANYFDWAESFRVEAGVEQMARHAFCDMCAKLHESNDAIPKFYGSMVPEWSAATQCRQWDS